jgi:membrane-bound metal-dependent hydrolase YbcI (DUF457 family)
MVMGPTHAVSGAAAWLIGCAAAHHIVGIEQSAAAVAVGTIACTGAALLPDLDCPGNLRTREGGSTVARTFGRASMAVSRLVERGSLGIVNLTRTRHDKPRESGHRTLTHTWLFAVIIGAAVFGLVAGFGPWAVAGVMFVLTGVAARGILPKRIRKLGIWGTIVLSAIAAALQAHLLPAGEAPIVLALAVAVGCIVHTLGDMLTKMGCPIAFPVPIKGKRWYELGLPAPLAIRAGAPIERIVLMPACTLGASIGAVLTLIPEVIQ